MMKFAGLIWGFEESLVKILRHGEEEVVRL
jgi:hypothetical protein